MARKPRRYPCPISPAEDGLCEYGGNRNFDYGVVSGTHSYCRKEKRPVFPPFANTPIKCPLSSEGGDDE